MQRRQQLMTRKKEKLLDELADLALSLHEPSAYLSALSECSIEVIQEEIGRHWQDAARRVAHE
jgi:hypothetical protein